jgi:hypothetical protein
MGYGVTMAGFDETQWHLLVVTWSKNDLKVRCYMDGDLVLSSTKLFPVDYHTGAVSASMMIDGGNGPVGPFASASLDELSVWLGIIFDPNLRAGLYNGGTGIEYPFTEPPPNPSVCWKFDNSLTDSVLGISMASPPGFTNYDFDTGKFGQALHSLAAPGVMIVNTGPDSSLVIS